MSHRRVAARMDASAADLTGLCALRVVMLEALPLDEQRDLEAQIEISFWGRALGNPALRKLQQAEFDRFADRLRTYLAERTPAASFATAWTSRWPPISCSTGCAHEGRRRRGDVRRNCVRRSNRRRGLDVPGSGRLTPTAASLGDTPALDGRGHRAGLGWKSFAKMIG
jgi:hypothetical protein